MSYNLPDGVTDAMIEEHFGGNPFCECGHTWDYHTEIEPSDDPQYLLTALRKIDELLGKPDSVGKIRNILDDTLTVCGAKPCDCRKFVEQ